MVSMEYTSKMEKLQATKGNSSHGVPPLTLLRFLLRVALLVGLLLSSARWLPILRSSLKLFSPKFGNAVTGQKFAFIVSNIIVIFLVGKSLLSRSSSAAAAQPDLYEEYSMRSQSLRGVVAVAEEAVAEEALAGEMMSEESKEEEEKGSVSEEILMEEEKEDEALAAEELNRRVEDFIAKVNMQRRMEARMLLI